MCFEHVLPKPLLFLLPLPPIHHLVSLHNFTFVSCHVHSQWYVAAENVGFKSRENTMHASLMPSGSFFYTLYITKMMIQVRFCVWNLKDIKACGES